MTTRFKKSRKMHAHRKRGPAQSVCIVLLLWRRRELEVDSCLQGMGGLANTASIRVAVETRVASIIPSSDDLISTCCGAAGRVTLLHKAPPSH